ncbi:MAG: hypothetical protein CMJ18_26090 [Phycisphaeraceae bacterium]|nr:hypothetical protein [Phycisphaeraceae bacterium]
MIERQRRDYSWQFNYLGADPNTFDDAMRMGIARGSTARFLAAQSGQAFSSASGTLARMRHASRRGRDVRSDFTPDERRSMGGSDDPEDDDRRPS